MKEIAKDLLAVAVICLIVYGVVFLIQWGKDLSSAARTDTNTVQVAQDANDPNTGL